MCAGGAIRIGAGMGQGQDLGEGKMDRSQGAQYQRRGQGARERLGRGRSKRVCNK